MAKPKQQPKPVIIEPGDKVCVEFDDGPFTGIVASVNDKKCVIGFDDGTTEECLLEDVKLISKAGAPVASDDVTAPTKHTSGAASPNAQQLAAQADANRRGRVDAANKAVAAKRKALDAENAGKPLTPEEKEFVAKVEARLNGKEYRSGDMMVRTARMTALPSSSDMTRYARLVRQMKG